MVEPRGCQGTNKDGSPCSATAVSGRGWCLWHDPEREADRQAARRRGGTNRSRAARARLILSKGLDDLGDLQSVLLCAILDVEAGRIDPAVANAMANLAGKVKDLVVGVELEKQIAELQRRTGDLAERVG